MFRQRKTRRLKKMNKTSLGELRKQYARTESQIQSIDRRIREVDSEITANLQKTKETMDEHRLKSISQKITECETEKKKLIHISELLDAKRTVFHCFISRKESDLWLLPHTKKENLLNNMDLNDLSEILELDRIQLKYQEAQKDDILDLVATASDIFDKKEIYAVVRATSLDDESIACAKAEIDAIACR